MTEEKKARLQDRLGEAISDAGMRPIELSEKTGIPKSMLSYYMNGKTKPKADRLYKIAQALDVSEAWLLGYDVPKQRSAENKKTDQLAKLIVKMRTDNEFYSMVSDLAELDDEKYQSIRQLVAALKK